MRPWPRLSLLTDGGADRCTRRLPWPRRLLRLVGPAMDGHAKRDRPGDGRHGLDPGHVQSPGDLWCLRGGSPHRVPGRAVRLESSPVGAARRGPRLDPRWPVRHRFRSSDHVGDRCSRRVVRGGSPLLSSGCRRRQVAGAACVLGLLHGSFTLRADEKRALVGCHLPAGADHARSMCAMECQFTGRPPCAGCSARPPRRWFPPSGGLWSAGSSSLRCCWQLS